MSTSTEEPREMRPGCFLLALALFCAGVAGAVYIIKTQPEADRREPMEQVLTVDTVTLALMDTQMVVKAAGAAVPARQIDLKAEVSGRVVWTSPDLVPGARVNKGDPLIRIDNRNYRAEVDRQTAAVEQARLNLRLEEGRKAVAEEEWKLLKTPTDDTTTDRDLVLREPQIRSARAQVAAAESALAKARADLERTELSAPFDAVILEEFADEGAILTPAVTAARLVGIETFRIQASVPIADLQWLERSDDGDPVGEVRVALSLSQDRQLTFRGEIQEWMADLDAAGRMARLLIAVPRPFEQADALPLFLNAYVDVYILGKPVQSVFHIPRAGLHEGDVVWIVDDDRRLAMRNVEVVRRLEHSALIRNGIQPGQHLITSRITLPMEGMKVQTREEALAAEPAAADTEVQEAPSDDQ